MENTEELIEKHEYLKEEMYYSSGSVGTRGQRDKTCEYCGDTIPKGEPHDTHKFYGENGDWPTYATHNYNAENPQRVGMTCSEKFRKSLN